MSNETERARATLNRIAAAQTQWSRWFCMEDWAQRMPTGDPVAYRRWLAELPEGELRPLTSAEREEREREAEREILAREAMARAVEREVETSLAAHRAGRRGRPAGPVFVRK